MRLLKLMIFSGLIIFPQMLRAEHFLFWCETRSQKGDQWVFKLSESGKVTGEIHPTRSQTRYQCNLKIRTFSDQPQGVIPTLQLDLEWGKCVPDLPLDIQKKLLDQVFILIESHPRNRKTETKIQWLKNEQTGKCALKKFEASELKLDHEKWHKGLWGKP